MSPEIISVLVLVGLFVLATVRRVHLGAAALAASWIVGSTVFGADLDEVLSGFPVSLFVTIVSVTFLFAIAEATGAIGLVVHRAVRVVGGRPALLPLVLFVVTAAITAVGAATPAAAAIVGPVATGLARKDDVHPVLMGMAVVQGATAGALAPTGMYGMIVAGVVRDNGLPSGPWVLFAAGLVVVGATVVAAFFVHGGMALLRRGRTVARADDVPPRLTAASTASLVGIVVLCVAAFGFGTDVGLTALVVAVVLAAVFPTVSSGAVAKVSWPTAFLVAGVVTYVDLLQSQGVVAWLGDTVAAIPSPLLAALAICLMAAVVSALASTTGILGALVPLAVPFLLTGHVWAVGLVAALTVSAAVPDCSPFSTNGALMVAYADEPRRETTYRSYLAWAGSLVVAGPLVAWTALVVVPSLAR